MTTMPDGWYDIAKNLPPGLDGALEPGGRENGRGIIPTNFHGLDFEIIEDAIKALLGRIKDSLPRQEEERNT